MSFLIDSARLAAGGGGAFSPADVSGLIFWLEADGTLWQDSGRTTPAISDGDPVGSWDDASGNGNHVTQGTSGNRPLLKLSIQNGKPVLRFDGSNDVLVKAALTLADAGLSVFVVGKLTASGSYPHLVAYGASGAGSWGLRTVSATGKLSFVDNGSNGGAGETSAAVSVTSTAANLAGTGFHLLEGHVSSGDAWEILVDAASKDTASNTFDPTAGGAQDIQIGGRTASSLYWPGDIAAVLIYNANVSAPNKASIRQFLNDKYAIY